MSTSFDGDEMTDKLQAKASGNTRRWWRIIEIVVLGFAVLCCTMSCVPKPGKKGALTVQLNNLSQVMICFRMYLQDNDSPPKTLADMAATGRYVGSESWSMIGKYKSPVTKKQIDWLYFPERFSSDGERIVIVASPESYDGLRLVGCADSSCRIISEAEFAQIHARGGKLEAPK